MTKRILIVDDSPVARMMIRNCLRSSENEYEIITAVDGREGVEKYQKFKPDITFMDITMPAKNGFQATEEIVAFDKNAVIIGLTADIQPKTIERIMMLGARLVIKKPPTPDLIQQALQPLMQEKTQKPGNDVGRR